MIGQYVRYRINVGPRDALDQLSSSKSGAWGQKCVGEKRHGGKQRFRVVVVELSHWQTKTLETPEGLVMVSSLEVAVGECGQACGMPGIVLAKKMAHNWLAAAHHLIFVKVMWLLHRGRPQSKHQLRTQTLEIQL